MHLMQLTMTISEKYTLFCDDFFYSPFLFTCFRINCLFTQNVVFKNIYTFRTVTFIIISFNLSLQNLPINMKLFSVPKSVELFHTKLKPILSYRSIQFVSKNFQFNLNGVCAKQGEALMIRR